MIVINYLILSCGTFTSILLFSGWYIGIASAAGFVAGAAAVVILSYIKAGSSHRVAALPSAC